MATLPLYRASGAPFDPAEVLRQRALVLHPQSLFLRRTPAAQRAALYDFKQAEVVALTQWMWTSSTAFGPMHFDGSQCRRVLGAMPAYLGGPYATGVGNGYPYCPAAPRYNLMASLFDVRGICARPRTHPALSLTPSAPSCPLLADARPHPPHARHARQDGLLRDLPRLLLPGLLELGARALCCPPWSTSGQSTAALAPRAACILYHALHARRGGPRAWRGAGRVPGGGGQRELPPPPAR